MDSLGHGFETLRGVAMLVTQAPAPESSMSIKLTADFRMECKKFLIYRAYRIRDRQHLSLQRIRALICMINEVQAFAA